MSTGTMLVLARDHVLSTLSGHVIRFVANEPVLVPDVAIGAAIAIGAAPASGELATPQIPPSTAALTPVTVPVDLEQRAALIKMAIDLVVKDQRSDEFDTAGYPKREVVSKYVGFTVSNNELLEVFDGMKAAEQAEKEVRQKAATRGAKKGSTEPLTAPETGTGE